MCNPLDLALFIWKHFLADDISFSRAQHIAPQHQYKFQERSHETITIMTSFFSEFIPEGLFMYFPSQIHRLLCS